MPSFGGTQYTLEFIIKVTGSGAGASQLTGLNNSMKQVTTSSQQATKGINTVGESVNRNRQITEQSSKAMKGLAFGLIGLTSAGVEAIGMLSMYRSTQEGDKEAHAEVDRALKESGANSKDYKDALVDLQKQERWSAMTRRNLILSFFDLVPFILLTINALAKLSNIAKSRRGEAVAEVAANNALTASITRQLSAIEANTGVKLQNAAATRTFGAAQSQAALASTVAAGGFTRSSIALGTGSAAAVVAGGSFGKLSGVFKAISSAAVFLVTKLGPIALVIGTILIAIKAWKENWGGFGAAVNQAGVQIGNIHPILKTTMELLSKLGQSIDALMSFDFGKLGEIWSGKKDTGIKTMTKAEEKALEEQKQNLEDYINFREDLGDELGDMKKKERKEKLFEMGFKGNEDNQLFKSIDKMNEFQDSMLGFVEGMSQIDQLNVFEDLGFKGMDKDFDKFFFTWEDRFDKFGDKIKKGTMFEGVDIKKAFEGLEDKLHEAGKNPGKGPEIIAKYLADNPTIMKYLDAAGMHTVAQHLKTIADDAIRDAMPKSGIKGKTQYTDAEKDKIWEEQLPEGPSAAEKAGAELGTGLINGLKGAFTGANANAVGMSIRTHLILPAIAQASLWGQELGAAVANALANFDIGAAITSTNAAIGSTFQTAGTVIPNFIAGLFGFSSDIEMYGEITNFFTNTLPLQFRVAWTNFSDALSQMFTLAGTDSTAPINTIGDAIGNLLTPVFGDITKVGTQARIWFDLNIIAPILFAWETIKSGIKNLFTVGKEVATKGIDVVGSILPSIFGDLSKIVSKARIWIDLNIIAPILSAWEGIKSIITGLFTAPEKAVKSGYDFINGLLSSVFGGFADIAKNVRIWIDLNIIAPILSVWEDIKSFISNMFSNPEVEDKTNTKKGGGNWLDDLVKSLFGFNTAEAAGPDGKPVVGMSIVIDKIDVSKLISDSGTAGTKIVQTFQNMADKVGAVFINIVSGWAVATSGMAEMSQAGAQSTVQNFSSMMDKTFAVFEGIATGWSIVCNSMGANAQSANKQVIKAFSDMWKKATSIFKSLASNWSKMMNSMISNAKSAAKGVNNALDSIKKEVVTVHRIVTQGSMAKGGIISAAGG
ncbi:MAG TPA: hypothetical protein VL854_08010, partial [Nitrososphaeraceae archaeon]|nr:hypothetical protein [Nitrososphaeraceae archaeon]